MTPAATRPELTIADRGRWLVATAEYTLAFDFRTGAVGALAGNGQWLRVRGDRRLRLKTIDALRVGDPGRWWMYRPLDGVDGPVYPFVSEPVTSIVSLWSPATAGAKAGPLSLGPAYVEETMRELLRVSEATLQTMAADLQVLQVITAGGRVFPMFQLTGDGLLIQGLREVLSELADVVDDPLTWWAFLAAGPEHSCHKAQWERLRDGEVEQVVRAASRSAWAWRQ